ncbi:hypothetical protein [Citromicrobium bathyomarinum]|uniref:hypothetical protein n=1 Tax=Citromicrobium bathyomarinum TaxID=72174 RepID=UPI00315B1E29
MPADFARTVDEFRHQPGKAFRRSIEVPLGVPQFLPFHFRIAACANSLQAIERRAKIPQNLVPQRHDRCPLFECLIFQISVMTEFISMLLKSSELDFMARRVLLQSSLWRAWPRREIRSANLHCSRLKPNLLPSAR